MPMPPALAKLNNWQKNARVGKSVLPLAQPATLRRDFTLLLALGALLGAVAFVAIYGVGILNPTYVEWLENNWGDAQQHYTGWAMYRKTPWTFPLGMLEGLTHPYAVSIAYTDSIPLFAVFFKLLSPILPASFQYFGLWGLFCYVMTGAAGAVLVRSFSPNKVYCLVGSAFFCFASTIVFRMYMHSALAGQWVILFALALWAYGDHLQSLKRNLLCWSVLLFVTAWVHPYFVPMVAGILLGYLVHSAIVNRRLAAHGLVLVVPLLFALLAMWLIGSFEGGGSLQNAGLGHFSFNLNGFFNPMHKGWSRFLSPLPLREGQYEGFAYMGVGFLALLAIAAALVLWRLVRALIRCGFGQTVRHIPLGAVCLLAIGIIFGIIALSPLVTANRVELFTIPYPNFVIQILMIFRCTSRFIWVSFFILLLGGLWLFSRWVPKKVAAVALCVLLCVQLYDISPIFAWRKNIVYGGEGQPILQSAAWQEVAEAHDHLVLETLQGADYEVFLALGIYALHNDATLSNYGLARNLPEAEATIREYYPAIVDGTLPADTAVLVFYEQNATVLRWLNRGGVYFYNLDGILVCTAAPLASATAEETLPALDGPLDVLGDLPYSLYLAEERENGGITIPYTGDIRGQRVYLAPGTYAVTFTGGGLLAGHVRAHSETLGKGGIATEVAEETADSITLRFTLTGEVYDLEFWAENPLEEDILLTDITLQNDSRS